MNQQGFPFRLPNLQYHPQQHNMNQQESPTRIPNSQDPSSPSSPTSLNLQPSISPSTPSMWIQWRNIQTTIPGSSSVAFPLVHVGGSLTGNGELPILDSTIDQMNGLKLTESSPEQQRDRSLSIPHVTVSEVEDEDEDNQRTDVIDAESSSFNSDGFLVPRPEAPKASRLRNRELRPLRDGFTGHPRQRHQRAGGWRPDKPLPIRPAAGRISKPVARRHNDRKLPTAKEETEMMEAELLEKKLKEGGFLPREDGSSYAPMM